MALNECGMRNDTDKRKDKKRFQYAEFSKITLPESSIFDILLNYVALCFYVDYVYFLFQFILCFKLFHDINSIPFQPTQKYPGVRTLIFCLINL